jgi:hypothetical protein
VKLNGNLGLLKTEEDLELLTTHSRHSSVDSNTNTQSPLIPRHHTRQASNRLHRKQVPAGMRVASDP